MKKGKGKEAKAPKMIDHSAEPFQTHTHTHTQNRPRVEPYFSQYKTTRTKWYFGLAVCRNLAAFGPRLSGISMADLMAALIYSYASPVLLDLTSFIRLSRMIYTADGVTF